MSVGGLLLKFQQTFGHGLLVAYYRDVVRPRILRTPPVVGTTDRSCEIHVLTSASDWLNLIWTLKSFYQFSSKRYVLCIHGDKPLRLMRWRRCSIISLKRIIPPNGRGCKDGGSAEKFSTLFTFSEHQLACAKGFRLYRLP